MQDENDWNALCELIRSGADRRFVLLSPWRASGLSDRLPVYGADDRPWRGRPAL